MTRRGTQRNMTKALFLGEGTQGTAGLNFGSPGARSRGSSTRRRQIGAPERGQRPVVNGRAETNEPGQRSTASRPASFRGSRPLTSTSAAAHAPSTWVPDL